MIFFINNTNSHRRGRHGKGIILFTQKIHLKNEKKNINDYKRVSGFFLNFKG